MTQYLRYRGAVYRRAYFFSEEALGYLYHVTVPSRLSSIARIGLNPNAASRDHVYLTEPGGLIEWIQYVLYTSEALSETPESYVVLRTPVLSQKELDRCGTEDAAECLLQRWHRYLPHVTPPNEQPLASKPGETKEETRSRWYQESRVWERRQKELLGRLKEVAKAWRTEHPVPPGELEVWSGSEWVPVQHWQDVKVPYGGERFLRSLTRPDQKLDPDTLELGPWK